MVPAAGFGSRMQAECPKQYLSIGGKTLLEHALAALLAHPRLGAYYCRHQSGRRPSFPRCRWRIDPHITGGDGGKERADSVLAGLRRRLPALGIGSRCCASLSASGRSRTVAGYHHDKRVGGILAAPVRDTMKRAEAGNQYAHTVEREDLWHALTPQLFPLELLRTA